MSSSAGGDGSPLSAKADSKCAVRVERHRQDSIITSLKTHTKLEVSVDKTVRGRVRTERGNRGGGATKKREISRTLFSINLHFLVLRWKYF